MKKMEGKDMMNAALITGASSGLGLEFARIHAQKGNDVIIVARRKDKLDELKAELTEKYGVEVMVFAMDLSLPDTPLHIFEKLKESGIFVKYLINNAGFGLVGKFHELDRNRQNQMIQLNVAALTSMTHLFLPEMIERNEGRILNVSSTASLVPGPLQAVYFASKAYVTSFSLALHEELRHTNVTVTALLPGATETEFGKVSGMDKTPMFRKTAGARRVAMDGYEAMMKGKLQVISGLSLPQKIMMALVPLSPKKMVLKQVRLMQEVK